MGSSGLKGGKSWDELASVSQCKSASCSWALPGFSLLLRKPRLLSNNLAPALSPSVPSC